MDIFLKLIPSQHALNCEIHLNRARRADQIFQHELSSDELTELTSPMNINQLDVLMKMVNAPTFLLHRWIEYFY